MEELDHAAVDALLSSTRKIQSRNKKACYPCHRRKVKCDRNGRRPCTNCLKSSHPELCSFQRSRSGSSQLPDGTNGPKTKSKQQEPGNEPVRSHAPSISTTEDVSGEVQSEVSATQSSGQPPTSDYFGPESIIALVQRQGQQSGHLLAGDPSPILASQNVWATDPLVNLNPMKSLWSQVEAILPCQKHILRHFGVYQAGAKFFPVVSNSEEFESQVLNFIQDQGSGRLSRRFDPSLGQRAVEDNLSHLGRLLAALSLGVQYSSMEFPERTKLAKEYAQNAYHCLRLANHSLRPSLISVQALILLTRMLQDDIQPDVSWTLLGSVIRSAQRLGLHVLPSTSAEVGDDEASLKHRVWKTIVWIDFYLTVLFGRPSDAFLSIDADPFLGTSRTNLAYHECMYLICGMIANTLRPKAIETRSVDISQAISAMKNIETRTLPHLKDKSSCRNIHERIEHFCLQIHWNFGLTYLTLRALRTGANDFNLMEAKLTQDYRLTCQRTLQAFLDMQAASGLPERNWGFLHRCLSSALLLGYHSLNDTLETKQLQKSFFKVLVRLKEEAKTGEDLHSAFCTHYSRAVEELERMCTDVPDVNRETQQSFGAADYATAWENINLYDSIPPLGSDPMGDLISGGAPLWDPFGADANESMQATRFNSDMQTPRF